MKQNINIFVMIGVIALVSGQLHGLTKEQSGELMDLKLQLDFRYAEGIPSTEPMRWLLENYKIIKQIEGLDFSAASPYKDKQILFFKEIQVKAKTIQKEPKKRRVKAESIDEKAKKILDEIKRVNLIISEKILENFVQYDHINFDEMKKLVVEIIDEIKSVKKTVTPDTYNALYLGVVQLMVLIRELLKIKKDNKQLSVYDFNQTAQVIQKMKKDLGIRFSWKPKKGRESLVRSVVMQVRALSTLKTKLYNIYGAKQAPENEVTILHDVDWSILGYTLFTRRSRSNPQHDFLAAIPPLFEKEEGWGEKLTRTVRTWFQRLKFWQSDDD